MPNPLTPKPGYTVTLSQIVGDHPQIHASCRRCVDFDIIERVDVASSAAQLAAKLAFHIADAIHHVSSHISDEGRPR